VYNELLRCGRIGKRGDIDTLVVQVSHRIREPFAVRRQDRRSLRLFARNEPRRSRVADAADIEARPGGSAGCIDDAVAARRERQGGDRASHLESLYRWRAAIDRTLDDETRVAGRPRIHYVLAVARPHGKPIDTAFESELAGRSGVEPFDEDVAGPGTERPTGRGQESRSVGRDRGIAEVRSTPVRIDALHRSSATDPNRLAVSAPCAGDVGERTRS